MAPHRLTRLPQANLSTIHSWGQEACPMSVIIMTAVPPLPTLRCSSSLPRISVHSSLGQILTAVRCEEKVGAGYIRYEMWLSLSIAGKTPGVIRAATQYGTESRIIDLATFDVTHNPWRCGELFDAIITDPPCMFGTTFFDSLTVDH